MKEVRLLDDFDLAGLAIEPKDRDDLGRGNVEAALEGLVVMPTDVPETFDLGLFWAYVAAAHDS